MHDDGNFFFIRMSIIRKGLNFQMSLLEAITYNFNNKGHHLDLIIVISFHFQHDFQELLRISLRP